MAIEVKINPAEEPEMERPKIKVQFNDNTIQELNFKLDLRRALNGDLMIFDHNDIVYMAGPALWPEPCSSNHSKYVGPGAARCKGLC